MKRVEGRGSGPPNGHLSDINLRTGCRERSTSTNSETGRGWALGSPPGRVYTALSTLFGRMGGSLRIILPLWENGRLSAPHMPPFLPKNGTHREAYGRVHPEVYPGRRIRRDTHLQTVHREAYKEGYPTIHTGRHIGRYTPLYTQGGI